MGSFPNHGIEYESLKEYFYRGQDDNNKAVLDMIAGISYGKCTYTKIAEKLEKISQNNKFGVLESHILGETPSQSNPHTTQSQMIFLRRCLK